MELTHSSRTSAEHHIFAAFDTDGDGTIDLAELGETYHALRGTALTDDELQQRLASSDGGNLSFEQFQQLLRDELPHVVEMLASINAELQAEGKRGLARREIAELMHRVGPKLVSMLEPKQRHSHHHRSSRHRPGDGTVSPERSSTASGAGARESSVGARESSVDTTFHAELHSLAAGLASAHRSAAQQWTDEEVEIIWLSNDAMERERDEALSECERLRAELLDALAERDALAQMASKARTQGRNRSPPQRARGASTGAAATARPLGAPPTAPAAWPGRARQQTLGLRNLTLETADDTQGTIELPDRPGLDAGYLECLDEATFQDMRDMVAECGVDGVVPALAMRSGEGMRGVMCAYVAGGPTATATQVSGYLWRKESMASNGWKLYWAILDCKGKPTLKFTSGAAHEAAILSDGTDCEPADVPASATDVYVKDCTEVRRSMAPLATGAELELVAASRTYRLCAVTRSDSGAWGRVLHAALQPDFGISSAKKKLRRAVRKQRIAAQLWTVDEFASKLMATQINAASAAPPPPPPQSRAVTRKWLTSGDLTKEPQTPAALDLHAQIRAAGGGGDSLRKATSVPVRRAASEWRHACDCPQNFMECKLCKSHFGPPRAPAFKTDLPDGCELLDSIRYNARRKEAKAAWPWAPFDEMDEYAQTSGSASEGQNTGAGLSSAPAAVELPPWAPFSPPFVARPPLGMGLVEGLQWRNSQEKAMRVHGIKKQQHLMAGHSGRVDDCKCWMREYDSGSDFSASDSDDDDDDPTAKAAARNMVMTSVAQLRDEGGESGGSDDEWSDGEWD